MLLNGVIFYSVTWHEYFAIGMILRNNLVWYVAQDLTRMIVRMVREQQGAFFERNGNRGLSPIGFDKVV